MYAFIVIIEMFQMFIERESETKNDKKIRFPLQRYAGRKSFLLTENSSTLQF